MCPESWEEDAGGEIKRIKRTVSISEITEERIRKMREKLQSGELDIIDIVIPIRSYIECSKKDNVIVCSDGVSVKRRTIFIRLTKSVVTYRVPAYVDIFNGTYVLEVIRDAIRSVYGQMEILPDNRANKWDFLDE